VAGFIGTGGPWGPGTQIRLEIFGVGATRKVEVETLRLLAATASVASTGAATLCGLTVHPDVSA
jgi:hypothetical protein